MPLKKIVLKELLFWHKRFTTLLATFPMYSSAITLPFVLRRAEQSQTNPWCSPSNAFKTLWFTEQNWTWEHLWSHPALILTCVFFSLYLPSDYELLKSIKRTWRFSLGVMSFQALQPVPAAAWCSRQTLQCKALQAWDKLRDTQGQLQWDPQDKELIRSYMWWV